MNALNAMLREQQEARAAAAIAKASTWTRAAQPLLRAYINLCEANADTHRFDGEPASDARDIITDAASRLRDEIESVRDRFIMDAQGQAPAGNDEATWGAYDELCEAVGCETPTIDQAVKATAREMVDEEMRRAA